MERIHSCNQGVIDGLLKQLAEKEVEIERLTTSKTVLTFKCKCGAEVNTSPIPMYESQIRDLQAELQKAKETLMKYGDHHLTCSYSPDDECLCGFEEAVK